MMERIEFGADQLQGHMHSMAHLYCGGLFFESPICFQGSSFTGCSGSSSESRPVFCVLQFHPRWERACNNYCIILAHALAGSWLPLVVIDCVNCKPYTLVRAGHSACMADSSHTAASSHAARNRWRAAWS